MVRPAPPTLIPFDVLHQVTVCAGGVLWRRSRGRVELALVHRSTKDDWGFPKGRVGAGESTAVAAVREVGEETGYAVHVGELLGSLIRQTRKGRSKVTTYWLMEPQSGRFRANHEIDSLVWVELAVAERALHRRPEAALFETLHDRLEPPSDERLATSA